MYSVLVLIILLKLNIVCLRALPLCSRSGDTGGTWLPVSVYEQSTSIQNHVKERFVLGGPGEAVNFSHIWVPDHCSYHRFTSSSLRKIAAFVQDSTHKSDPIRLIVLADSGTRALLCGITRILSGSEVFGPCENEICGTIHKLAMSYERTNMEETVVFDYSFSLSFIYVKSLLDPVTREEVKKSISKKPYAVLLNTGAWDFRPLSDLHQHEVANDLCDTEAMDNVSLSRAQPAIHEMLHETGAQAHALGVRAIYRTNHHNARFGSHCADDHLLTSMSHSGWEVWDNRRISQSVWRHQILDGFHYDRDFIHTVQQHMQNRHNMIQEGKDAPGMLEMQLTQSLLHLLFRDALQELIDQGFDL